MTPLSRRARISASALLTLTLTGLLTATVVPGLSPAQAAGAARAAAPSVPSAPSLDAALDPRSLADPIAGLPDLDARGAVTPTAAQRRAAAGLGAVDLRWNRFGTPGSILPASGVLARTTSSDPVTAARSWLEQHAAVFALTPAQAADLEMVNDQKLAAGGGDAVLFRQRFGTLTPALDGMVTVGVAHGEIDYVSSSLTRTAPGATAPTPTISPVQGWVRAARSVGIAESDLAGLTSSDSDDDTGWTRIEVPGIVQQQLARTRALVLANGTVRPVIESDVIDVAGGNAMAYTVLVDAVTGDVLTRQNQVDNDQQSEPFTGSITATACGPRHAFTLSDDKTRSIVAVAAMANSADDIVLKILGPDGATLTSSDTATSPEVATYTAASIPAGTYSAQVCPFPDATTPPLPPYNYALTVTTSDSSTGSSGGVVPSNPRWRFFTANPTLDSPSQTPHNSVIGCWLSATGCTAPTGAFTNVAAAGPWDTVGGSGISTNTTVGNNASTHEAWLSPLSPGGLMQAPISATRTYTTPFTDVWNNSRCNPDNLVPGGNDINASIGNLFVIHNEMHDWSYYLGFTEKNYNLQADNLGRGGSAHDVEVGNGQAGALSGGQPSFLGRDNANQIALQDGVPGITNQYLFQPIAGAFYAPCTDGELDQGIVGHEYTHAISNRMVGGPDEGLTGAQAGAMGESWSDLDAAEFQFAHGYKNGGNTFAVGLYATANKKVAIRDYSIDKNPLNYSDVGFDTIGVEVHADGEIWNGTQGEVRAALVKKWNKRYPYADKRLQLRCAQATATRTPTPPQKCPGNRRWIQLVFDSFLLQQGATSMLDARDAMIAADRMRFHGANHAVLWDAFARRGMGKGASSHGTDDGNPRASFSSPTSKNTTVTFRTPAAGNIYVGDYQARARPVADTVKKTKLGASARFTPGTYDLLYVSPRDGFRRFALKVTGGGHRTVRIKATRNLAGSHAGAKVISATPGSRNPQFLIDGSEDVGWAGVTGGSVDRTHPAVAVDLAGGTHTIRTVAVSAMLRPAFSDIKGASDADAGSRFTALRRFAVQACRSACGTKHAHWRTVYRSSPSAFPALRPRPVAPNLILRTFRIKPTRAKALRLVALQNQCTGYRGYRGELDADPTNDTDCVSGSDRGTIVHVAEFQAFSKRLTPFRSTFPILNRRLGR